MEAFSDPKVTIDLKEYNYLKSIELNLETLEDRSKRDLYDTLMDVLYQQSYKLSLHYDDGKPHLHFKMPYEEFKKHYIK